jgi:hypothetical protein
MQDSKDDKSPERTFEETTRSLNLIISRLAFHEMRIRANTVSTEQLLRFIEGVNAGSHLHKVNYDESH